MHDHDGMADDLREAGAELIRSICAQRGWSSARLAREAGVAPSTLFRALEPNGKFVMSTRTKAKIEAFADGHAAAPPKLADASQVALHQLPNGKVRLRIDKMVEMPVALKVLTILEGGE